MAADEARHKNDRLQQQLASALKRCDESHRAVAAAQQRAQAAAEREAASRTQAAVALNAARTKLAAEQARAQVVQRKSAAHRPRSHHAAFAKPAATRMPRGADLGAGSRAEHPAHPMLWAEREREHARRNDARLRLRLRPRPRPRQHMEGQHTATSAKASSRSRRAARSGHTDHGSPSTAAPVSSSPPAPPEPTSPPVARPHATALVAEPRAVITAAGAPSSVLLRSTLAELHDNLDALGIVAVDAGVAGVATGHDGRASGAITCAEGGAGGGDDDADGCGDAVIDVAYPNDDAGEEVENRLAPAADRGAGAQPLGTPPRKRGSKASRSDNALLDAATVVQRTEGLVAASRRASRSKSRSRSKKRPKSKKRTKIAMLELKTQRLHRDLLATTGAMHNG